MPRRRRPDPAVLALVGLALGLATVAERGRRLDERLFAWANRHRGPALDRLFLAITELGSIWASAAAAGTMALRGHRREAADALGAAGAMWVVGQALKRAFGRARPYDARLPAARLLIARPSGTSWPSSHPAVLLSFVTVAARDLDVPSRGRVALAGLAGAVAWSRVHLGVHFPADVAGGLLLGRAVGDAWTAGVSRRILG